MKYFIILAIIISVVLYYGIGELFRQMQKRTVRRRMKRLVVCALIVGLLTGQADLVNFLTKTGAETVAAEESDMETGEAGSRMITAFAELPDDVREQTVPVGTALDELILPDTLEAVVVTDTETNADADEGEDTDTNGDTDTDADVDSDADSDEDTDIGDDADVNTEVSVDADTDKEADVDPDVDIDTDVTPDNDMLGDIDDTEGDTEKVETFSITMPEYRTGNVIEVKTLEMAPAVNYETIEETIIIENVTWQSEPEYDDDMEGEYVFTAILPQGHVLTSGVNMPQITVTVGGTDDTALLSGDDIMPIAEHTHDGITFIAWTDTTSLPGSSGNYYLEYDVTLSTWWQPSANITLCLNGHTITYDGLPIRVQSGRTLGIYDCQGNGAVTTTDSYCIRIFSGGTANIYGGTFNGPNGADVAAIYVEGTITIENASVFGQQAVQIVSNGMATINGGTFESTVAGYPTIELQSGSTTKISGGTFIHKKGSNVIQNNQGTLEMSGGTVIGKSTSDRGSAGIVNYGRSATATIKNVTITTEGTYIDDVNDDTLVGKADKGFRNDNGGTMTVENCNITSSNWAVWNTGGSTIKISSGTFNGRYGMYNNNGTFELSGSPTFTGSIADIYLSSNQKITVTGILGNAAPYSVLTQTNPTAGNPVVITDSSTTSYNVAAKFTAAGSSYIVRKNGSDQLELAVPATYTITYNAGSYGSGSVSSGTKTEGVDFTLSSQTFTRTGYTQTDWSKNSNGSTKDYALGAIYTDDASITLYPYWTANEYDITYMDQGGAAFSGTHESGYSTKHAYGTATTLKSASKTGYTFNGWYTDSSCTNKVTSLGATDYTSDITLYAKWTEGTAPPKAEGGSSSGGGGSAGGNSNGPSSGSGNGSQPSENNSGSSLSDNPPSDSVTPSTGTTPPKTDTVETVMPDTDEEQRKASDRQTETGTRNERNNSTGTNRASASSSTSTDNQSSQPASADVATDSTAGESSETGRDAGQSNASGTDGRTTGSTVQTVKAELKNGKITVEGDVVVTGTVRTAETTTMTLIVGEGSVIVTVVSDEYRSNAGVADTVAVANAVLTPEQIQRVNNGETVEIRVDVKDISSQVSKEDKDIIESGLVAGGTDGEGAEELTLGAYIDISMYIKIGDGDWDAITRADEPIEVVIGIPEELQGDGRTYYIARAHEGEYALLEDLDHEPDTITIKTSMFSTYAVVFKQMPGASADASSGFLASLSWTAAALWSLGILVMIALAVILILWKRRKEEDDAS